MIVAWMSVAVAGAAWMALSAADRGFRREFRRRAAASVALAGPPDGAVVREEDLRDLPEPLARWIRWSGAVGRPRPSVLRLSHAGAFKASAKLGWRPIRGEYVITTRPPSFTWYGRIRLLPGVAVAAIDAYVGGRGRMQVKALSALTVVDARTPDVDRSAFGRCLAELSMVPTSFLDRALVHCEQVGPDHLRVRMTDGALSGELDVFVNADGAPDRAWVMRPFDRGGGSSTLERCTFRFSSPRSWDGRLLAAHVDGTWNLPEGDLHYVAFDVERVAFE